MKRVRTAIAFVSMLSMTSAALAQAPSAPRQTVNDRLESTVELVFVLDTTGSMGSLLEGAKRKIWSIVNSVQASPARPNVRVGLVSYRDRWDGEVVSMLGLTSDLDRVYTTLMGYSAYGGGDRPEDVRQGLAAGVRKAGWASRSPSMAQIVFLVGDAPPHDDYADQPDTIETAAAAAEKGIIINAIQCGNGEDTRAAWQRIASRGGGSFFAIAQDGGVQSISSPFDSRLSELGAKIGDTYLPYGAGRADKKAGQKALEDRLLTGRSSSELADRAMNKAVNRQAYDEFDLIQSIESGKVTLEVIKPEDLPDEFHGMTPAAVKKEIDVRIEARKNLRTEILKVSKDRDDYVAAERSKRTATADAGFDGVVTEALKKQIASRGINLE
jgi:Mg-chelatase subunit ChlD